jgi:hypothetical protein
MKFGIFIFGDNHPELYRSNQAFYEQILTMANGPRSLALFPFGSASIIFIGMVHALHRPWQLPLLDSGPRKSG